MDDNIIKRTFETQIGKEVCSINKFDNVPNNQVYKIETESQNYIFKIYAKRDWPEDGKIPFVARKLEEHKIPYAKLFKFERNDVNFPNGYLIEECLPGITADRLVLSESETVKLFEKLAVFMSQVHQIELENYGYTGSGIAEWSTFSEFIYDMFDDCTFNLREQNVLNTLKLDAIKKNLYKKLKECDCYPPVICHGDLSTKNVIVNLDEIVLIDWDDVQSLCWMSDIARLTFWMKLNYGDKADIYRNAFLNSYETAHNKEAFDDLEDYLHMWFGLDYLNFSIITPNYQYQTESIKAILQKSLLHCGMEEL
ncbi:MAG: aminoglycoside phosphotransferase family protein [Eubacteriales bacterium]|nr:aminoglycoside phosphotransferase family protein [Eubacteriales bacterium]